MNIGRPPSLRTERGWLQSGQVAVAGSDEVGRGPLAGPVTVGVVIVDASTTRQPNGLRDSKLLAPPARRALVPRIKRWAVACAVGHASAADIDALGILRALRLAGERALAGLPEVPELVLLDGNYDWFRRPLAPPGSLLPDGPRDVYLRIKADVTCASVAAASVIAKVERDAIMEDLADRHPGYGWRENKGYATPDHIASLRERGPCCEHRRSWRLACSLVAAHHGEPALGEPAVGEGGGGGGM
jgi:ribonuclease HII